MSDEFKKPAPQQFEKQQQDELREHQLKLAQDLIENDEKNQFWKTVERVGNFFSRRYTRFMGFWRRY